MRIQVLKTLVDGNVRTKKGTIYEEQDWKARELIAKGYAVRIPEVEKSVAAPLVAANDNKGESADPFLAPRRGGQDGLAKPALLSQADQAPRKRKSRKRADAAE